MTEPSSRELINRCVEGDSQARTMLVERYHARLVHLARHEAGSRRRLIEPDSVVNEVFLRFLRLAESGRVEWKFKDGLWHLLSRMTVLRMKEMKRAVRDPRRTSRGVSRVSGRSPQPLARSYDETFAEVMDDFREVLAGYRERLNDEKRIVFDQWLDGRSSTEIGNAVGCSDRTVRRILERFREELSSLFNSHLDEPSREGTG